MSHTDCLERLSSYLDGELTEAEQHAVAGHLSACHECAGAAEDLRRITTAAREMPPVAPGEDLWPAIAARLEGPANDDLALEAAAPALGSREASWWRRRVVLSWPQALGAAAAVAAVTMAAAFLLQRGPLPETSPQGELAAYTESLAASSDAAYRALSDEVHALRERLARENDRLDPETVRVLSKNLRLIDDAIAQSRAALASDPASADETGRFVASLSGKLELLRQATDVALAQANGG